MHAGNLPPEPSPFQPAQSIQGTPEGIAGALHQAARAYPSMPDSVLAPVRPVFRAIAQTVVPEAASLPEAEWAALQEIVEQQLATRPRRLQRQLVLLIRLIDLLPLVTRARRFA